MSKLREAAIAVYARWDSPLWKDLPHTGEYMQALCDALNEPDRIEVEYQAATLRIDNDLMVIAELTAERDAYAAAADDMAMSHKVERDALQSAARLALDALEQLHSIDTETESVTIWVEDEIEALKKAGVA